MMCPDCGVPLKTGARFCGVCGMGFEPAGSPLKNAAAVPTGSPQPDAKRGYCGKCGSELRANGTCMRCVARQEETRNARVSSEPFTFPRKTVAIAGSALGLILAAVYGFKAWKGEALVVRTTVPDAVILVNNREVGRTSADPMKPLKVEHLRGKLFVVTARAEGYGDAKRQLLSPLPPNAEIMLAPVAKPAELQISAAPGSLILLNNRAIGRADSSGVWTSQDLRHATYWIAVQLDGRSAWTHQITLQRGERQTLTAEQPEVPNPLQAPTVMPEGTTGNAEPKIASAKPPLGSPSRNEALAQIQFERARQYFAARRYREALGYCQAGIQLVPNDAGGRRLCERIEDVNRNTGQ